MDPSAGAACPNDGCRRPCAPALQQLAPPNVEQKHRVHCRNSTTFDCDVSPGSHLEAGFHRAIYDAVTPGIGPLTYVDPFPAESPASDAPYFCLGGTTRCTSIANGSSDAQGLLSVGDSQSTTPSATPISTATTASTTLGSDENITISLAEMTSHADAARRDSLHSPGLALSGNIVSATFTTPNALTYRQGQDWTLKPRRGQSALYDSLAYLSSSESPWNHCVVAWTGEIEEPPRERVPSRDGTTVGIPALNALSAPVPVKSGGGARLPTPPPSESGLWIPREDQLRLEDQLANHAGIKTLPVWLAGDMDGLGAPCHDEEGILLNDQCRWRRYAEHDLCSLLHYQQHEPSDCHKERVQWADYYRMNQCFAKRILDVYKPGDIVIVHDYYLMLLPSMLRERVPDMYIAFYLHCPFPSSEFLRCLPRRREVLEGVLGANLVGFQSYSYSRHFLSCCTRILGFPWDSRGVEAYGAHVQVGIFPIGIDAAKVEAAAFVPSVDARYQALRKMYGGKKIIVGRDRLDSVRGVVQKLQAFERFLDTYPEWRDKVVLIQVTSPTSKEPDRDHADNRVASRVNELVMRINGRHGTLGFAPVQHFSRYLSQDEYFALMRAADIGLITSVRDGMNTASLEYVVCQRDGHGPLILSEFSGTAGSLTDAIHINPWDLGGVAEKIDSALSMGPEDRAAMHQKLYRHVTTHNVQSWISRFIRRVQGVLGEARDSAKHATPQLDRSLLLAQYRSADRRLLMFDYDGTLTPIVREPSAAIPSSHVILALKQLSSDPRNAVWIISGRDQDFLSHHLGHISQLGFSAEHGSFMRYPGSSKWINLAESFDMGWQEEVVRIFQKYTDRVSGSFIERKRCAVTWHFRLADPELGLHMARECQRELQGGVAREWDIEVMPGKANIEVRPRFINKGEIAKRLVATYHNAKAQASEAERNPGKVEFALCVGDDFTDEDMFCSLNGASGPILKEDHVFTVTVGPSTKATVAKWHLLDPADVVDCVKLLAGQEEHLSEVNLAALSAVEGRVPDEDA
ncbi:hypothetical protein CDD81_7161 [Ophiocordyceps australis]|uniref:Uncharacterized protein n=1 Tax=Ophiocordyceps australis TaxID=1399860 RepID=A0A2C5Y5C5_9HYPO|nr:hypothetical protein CDD81_7161 [Ophiocordyceps australis]